MTAATIVLLLIVNIVQAALGSRDVAELRRLRLGLQRDRA